MIDEKTYSTRMLHLASLLPPSKNYTDEDGFVRNASLFTKWSEEAFHASASETISMQVAISRMRVANYIYRTYIP